MGGRRLKGRHEFVPEERKKTVVAYPIEFQSGISLTFIEINVIRLMKEI